MGKDPDTIQIIKKSKNKGFIFHNALLPNIDEVLNPWGGIKNRPASSKHILSGDNKSFL